MIINKYVRSAASVFFGLALPLLSDAQSYSFTAPSQGYQELAFSGDQHFGPGGILYGASTTINFGTVDGIFTYNVAASSVRIAGSVELSSYSGSTSFQDYQYVNGNPVLADVTVNYLIGNVHNGAMSFDTGNMTVANPNKFNFEIAIPVSGSYSVVEGGQTYAGAFSYALGLPLFVKNGPASGNTIPISFSTAVNKQDDGGGLLAQVITVNGMNLGLSTMDPSDGQTYWGWNMQVTGVVPEPSTYAILGCGLVGLALARRRK
jgi:hypothetical protein